MILLCRNHITGSHHQPWNFGLCELDQDRMNVYEGINPMNWPRHLHGTTSHYQTPFVRRAAIWQRIPMLSKQTVQKRNLHCCCIRPKELEEGVSDRLHWRTIVHQATVNFEEARCQQKNQYSKRSAPPYNFGISHKHRLQVSLLLQTLCSQTWFTDPPPDVLINYKTMFSS